MNHRCNISIRYHQRVWNAKIFDSDDPWRDYYDLWELHYAHTLSEEDLRYLTVDSELSTLKLIPTVEAYLNEP